MSHLLCSLLLSHASNGMGFWSTSCWRIGAGKKLVRLAADSLTLEPCAGSKQACLMSACVLIFFTAFQGCWIFCLFLSPIPSLLLHLARLTSLPPCSVPVSPDDAFLTWIFPHLQQGGAGRLPHCSQRSPHLQRSRLTVSLISWHTAAI